MTGTQKTTLILLFIFWLYEFVLVRGWTAADGGRIIRFDLFLIIPVLSILSIISIVQWLKNRKKKTPENMDPV